MRPSNHFSENILHRVAAGIQQNFLFLAAFVDGFLRAIGIIPPFMDIDINLMNQVIEKVKDEVIKVIP